MFLLLFLELLYTSLYRLFDEINRRHRNVPCERTGISMLKIYIIRFPI